MLEERKPEELLCTEKAVERNVAGSNPTDAVVFLAILHIEITQ